MVVSRVREERIKRGWSITRLTVLTGINSTSLSQLERGKLTVFPGWRRRLAQAFELSEEELFGKAGEPGAAA